MSKVNVIGLGYIGLPTALMLASHGVAVVGTDYNAALVDALNRGETTFREEGLEELFAAARAAGVEFTTQYQATDVYIVSVPTPYDRQSKKVDARYVVQAVEAVLEICPAGAVVVIESTVSPGTVDRCIRPLLARLAPDKAVRLAHAPERIIPGNMIYELTHNNRTIGADDPETGERVRALYASFCRGEIAVTSIKTAEMTKVVENTFRDINIAYANELAKICRSDGMDVYEIIRITNKHPRVNILSPGPGVGGHCISVDPWFLVGDYPGLANIILAARKINDSMPEFVLERVWEIMGQRGLKDVSRVGLYGLTYKEDVDDVRNSPGLQMLEILDRHLAGGRVQTYDPLVRRDLAPNQHHDLDSFLAAVDLVVILVGHRQILENMDRLRDKVVLDTRNVCRLEGVYRL